MVGMFASSSLTKSVGSGHSAETVAGITITQSKLLKPSGEAMAVRRFFVIRRSGESKLLNKEHYSNPNLLIIIRMLIKKL